MVPVYRRRGFLVASVILTAVVAVNLPGTAGQRPASVGLPVAHAAGDRPNIVLVVTDDQRPESLAGMPHVQRLLVAKGTTFSNAMVPTSLCCPSRTSILTGLYSHHTRVFGNGRIGGDAHGGWPKFHARGLERRTFAVALRSAGYRTGLFGKYLNHFGDRAPRGYRPPGWDTFVTFRRPNAAYYSYQLTDGTRHGVRDRDYSTDVLGERAVKFVRSAPRTRPFLVMYTPYAPHAPYVAAPRFAGTPVSPPRTFGQDPTPGDIFPGRGGGFSPMPPLLPDAASWVVDRHRVAAPKLDMVPEAQLRSLLAVDEQVGALVRAVRETGRLHDTLFVFMSDNGYLWGEHGMVGKDAPYSPAARIPLILRWDGHVPAGRVDHRLAVNVDVAPTFAAAAGVPMRTDGLDLRRSGRRSGFVLEAMTGNWLRPPYCGWRTKDWLFVHYADGTEELFDVRRDPGERHNLAGITAVAQVQAELRASARAACRPVPPGFRWSPG